MEPLNFLLRKSVDTKVDFPIKVSQNLVNILVENHKRKVNEKSEENVSPRTLTATLSKYSRQHLVTNGIHGPSTIGAVRPLNIPHLGLNGGNIQIGQASGKMKVILSMKMMTHVVKDQVLIELFWVCLQQVH
ncbi:hypothetical protein JHK85_025390 [Glycine max]|nr:hypothetical protein JHK85_025390 [Glycine max]